MPWTRRGALGLVAVALVAPRMAAADLVRKGGPTYAVHGRAVGGIDVVGYFSDRTVVAGEDAHATAWHGALWCFTSAEHQAAFEADPRAYAPKYGGYCAYSMSLDVTMASDPADWRIVDGRLYLFSSADARTSWETDVPGNIARANANWPAIRRRLLAG